MRSFVAAAMVLACAGAAWAATPPPGTVTLTGPGTARSATPAEIATWPVTKVNAMFMTGKGMVKAGFSGPLLWTVLCDTAAADPTKPRDLAHEYAVVTGSDGYRAVIALGEIAPMFEGKTVILADSINGKQLPPGNFRLIVQGDQAGARDVKNVVKIAVIAAP